MSGPYTVANMFGRGAAFDCENEDCEKEHIELPDGRLHHEDCECEDCSLYCYLYIK